MNAGLTREEALDLLRMPNKITALGEEYAAFFGNC